MPSSTQRQLDIFAQIVALGDLEMCARDLALPLETVEAELAALEDRLGVQLFARAKSEVHLTAAGRKTISAMEMLAGHGNERWTINAADHRTEIAPPASEPLAEPEEEEDRKPAQIIDAAEAKLRAWPARQQPEPLSEAPAPIAEAASSTEETTIRPPRSFRPLPSAKNNAPDHRIQNIVLAAHPAIFSHFQEALAAFEGSSPDVGITLRLEGLSAFQVEDLFEQNLADIAYFYALEEPLNFVSRYAWNERISLFIAADHPLAEAGSVLARDLDEEPYLALHADNAVRQLTEAALERTGLTCPEPDTETDNLADIITLIQQGKGYFACMGTIARDLGKMKNISRLAYAQGLPQVEVRQAIRPEMHGNEAVLALAEFLFR
jgi:DNA-binding transcriptional LysR family regulator